MSGNIKLSIIVPIYNVEEYLDECLASLKKQTLKDIEVLMVNDGSTDHSADIAKRYEQENKNFRYFYKENGGLGNTRNFAIPYVTGEYLTFMDSDDIIPEDAYEKMYDLAAKTGNDLIIGNVVRFNTKKVSPSAMHKKVFDEDYECTSIYETPKLIYDTISCNKLFKTTFFRENHFQFPEKILYEDIPVTVPAYFKANGVSVLTDVCYLWRIRDGVSKSITQNRTDIKNFTDRIKVLDMVKSFYDSDVNDEHALLMRDYKWLDVDLKIYINQFLEADDNYRSIAMKEINRYLNYIDKKALDMLRAIDKIKYYYIQNNDLDSLLNVLRYQKTLYKSIRIHRKNKQYIGDFPMKNIPESLKVMTNELEFYPLVSAVKNINVKENKLYINAIFYISRLSRQDDFSTKAYLYSRKNNRKIPIEIHQEDSKYLTSKNGYRFSKKPLKLVKYDYSKCAYQIILDLDNQDVLEILQDKVLILIDYHNDVIHKEFFLGKANQYSLNLIQSHIIHDGVVSSHLINDGNLQIVYNKDIAMIENVSIEDGYISLESQKPIFIKQGIEIKEFTTEGNIQKYPIKDISSGNWYIYENIDSPMACIYTSKKGQYHCNQAETIFVENDKIGHMKLSYQKANCVVKNLNINSEKITLDVKCFDSLINNSPMLVLENKTYNYKIYIQPTERKTVNKCVELVFDIDMKNSLVANQLAGGDYIFYMQDKPSRELPLCIPTQICKKVVKTSDRNLRLQIYDNHLSMKVEHIWNDFENSRTKRRLIKKYVYSLFRKLPLKKKCIVFEGWWGEKCHCNPKAIYEYIRKNHPEYECIWVMKDNYIPVTGHTKCLRRNTLKYYYYLARAKYLVNNVNFHENYEKRNGQLEIQTMHGTPLKTMGFDVPGELDDPIEREKFTKKCNRWDYLVVQSQFAADVTERCFRFKKTFLKTGYPRNDILFAKNNQHDISLLKEKMGIPIDKKVILYAPTWRKRNYFEMRLDLEDMKREFGDEYVLILRVHPFAYSGFDKRILNDFVYNFSTYESVEELYLISDFVITDYSSVMFDYTVLNRPILFFTYDLTEYRDFLRGFTFDFEKEAPGPLLMNYDELKDAIYHIDEVAIQYNKALQKFRNKFNEFEDGKASEKIFNEVFKKS